MQTTPSRPTSKATPPSSARRQANSDRFIPSRSTTNLEDAFDILENKMNYQGSKSEQNIHDSQVIMNNLLRSELLGQTSIDPHSSDGGNSSRSSEAYFQSPQRKDMSIGNSSSNMFKFRPSSSSISGKSSMESHLSNDSDNLSSMSPARRSLSIGSSSGGPKPLRKIPKAPYKILDAPALHDDYYLNLLDWSQNNVLAVALNNCVYLWSACTAKVVKLCEYDADSETVTAIAWSISSPNYISVGTSQGRIQIWDATSGQMIRELRKHESRVGALAWTTSLLASGSRDRSICVQDIRMFVHGSSGQSRSHTNNFHRNLGDNADMRVNSNIDSGIAIDQSNSTNEESRNQNPQNLSTPPRTIASNTVSHIQHVYPPSPLPNAFPHFQTFPSLPPTEQLLAAVDESVLGMSLFSSSTSRLEAMRGVFSPLPPPPASTTATGVNASPSIILASPSRGNHPLVSMSSTSTVLASTSMSNSLGGMVRELRGHRQEVCGLKWSFDEKLLASGGNDNKLNVWEPIQHTVDPLYRFEDHTAAVKAVAWSPHQAGLLASGGGTADRHIRFWNAQTGLPLHKIDTGSQVCNLMWSRTVNEVVSTHGYSLNQIIVWKYPSMQKLATLSGHTMRVLFLSMSPDGQNIVTGAGDETLRFWNIFPPPRNRAGITLGQSVLIPSTSDVR